MGQPQKMSRSLIHTDSNHIHVSLNHTTKDSDLSLCRAGAMFTIILVRVQMTPVSLKHSLHTTVGKYIFACIAALLLACSTVPMRADVDDCTCNADSLLKGSLSICISGTTYAVDVYGCKRVLNVYPWLPEICATSGRQNQYTTITRVCFVGTKPTPINASATFQAILCALDPCKTPGVMGAFVPPVAGSIYCWTVFFPKCVEVNNATGCIYKCSDGCCIVSRRWKREDDGTCTRTGVWVCPNNSTECNSPCEQVTCPDPYGTCCN